MKRAICICCGERFLRRSESTCDNPNLCLPCHNMSDETWQVEPNSALESRELWRRAEPQTIITTVC